MYKISYTSEDKSFLVYSLVKDSYYYGEKNLSKFISEAELIKKALDFLYCSKEIMYIPKGTILSNPDGSTYELESSQVFEEIPEKTPDVGNYALSLEKVSEDFMEIMDSEGSNYSLDQLNSAFFSQDTKNISEKNTPYFQKRGSFL